MKEYSHIIIGTGQALGTLLGKLISTGERIAVIEGNKVGGSCVNYGCTPTKTLVSSAKAIHQSRRGDTYGFKIDNLRIDYSAIRERMNKVRNASNEGLIEWMESTDNIDLIKGYGAFTGPKTIEVNGDELEGKNIYINTGTYAFVPPIEGVKNLPWMDSAKLLELENIPKHLIVIGGGYIGVEFAQVYRRFGSEVTVIQSGDQLMPHEDKDVADTICEFLEEEGVNVLLNTRAKKASGGEGDINIQVEKGDEIQNVQGTHLLIAAGRRPNSKCIGLDKAGIEVDERGFIRVNDFCETNINNVYALGDVNGEGAFTHTSVNDAEILVDHLYGNGNRKISGRIPIYALFTDPPLGRVGMSEKEALEKGHRVLKGLKAMSEISRAKEMAETKGFAKLLVDADTDLILGASILGPGGDEIVNMFAAIMDSKIPCHNYRKVVLVHPTISELMPFVLDGLELVE